MNAHASINRIFRLIWSEALGSWIPVSEITRGRGKRSARSAALLAMVTALGLGAAQAAAPAAPAAPATVKVPMVPMAPLPTQLPTGGTVVAGSATITPGSIPNTAVLNIDQTTQRAVIDWKTFNLGSAAQVNFETPNSQAATLNRVLDSNASQIFGKITGNGQVFLSNPNGVYFGKSASVDVGSLAATTNGIGDAAFMEGRITLSRDGSTGSVVNEGHLQAGIGGYIALLAPEVRNGGVIVAHLGTVAMASGESITLNFDGNHLAGITVQPSAIAALVENKGAVLAPGGLIILSAKALDHLQGGVVKNSGTLEATGLSSKGGRIVLEASDSVENSGSVNADAGAGGPAGSVTITAPDIINSGSISAAVAVPLSPLPAMPSVSGGNIALNANTIVQTATGQLDASGMSGGSVRLEATQDITAAGIASAAGVASATAGEGGKIAFTAGRNITLQDALVDASGVAGGGEIMIRGGGQAPSNPPDPPTLALLGGTVLRTSSRRGKGGSLTLDADRIGLFDSSSIDASGATGGGNVFVGGGFHGKDPSMVNAQQVVMGGKATIDASATQAGVGGNVAVWSDGQTTFAGSIIARGGAAAGAGGFVEVSGKGNLNFTGIVDAGAAHGAAGMLLLDPQNITVDAAGTDPVSAEVFATTPGTDSIIAPSAITAITNLGNTTVTLQANNDLTINSSIVTVNAAGTGGALVFRAGRSITVNASVVSDDGNISFTANDSGAVSANRAAGTAAFVNNSVIDAGSGTVTIIMDTFAGTSGAIATGHVAAANLTITQRGPTAGAVSGAIDLGQSDLTGNLTISATDRNVTNTLGATGNAGNVVVRGTTSIIVGTGDVTITGPHTDFSIIGLTAGNVSLNDTNAVQFAATTLSGNLSEITVGPIGSTGAVQVGGTTNLTANNGGFGYADPYIALTSASNHFTGAVMLSVPTTGATGTGGYANIRDSGAITVASSGTASFLQIQAAGAITLGPVTAGTTVSATTSSGAITTATTSANTSVSLTTSNGTVTTGTTTTAYLSVAATGAVSLGASAVSTDLSVSTNGAITDTGTLVVGRQTTLTAGSANNITLDSPNDDFSSMYIVSANNATLVDKNGINFGAYCGCGGYNTHVYGSLSLTAGGDIIQTGQSGGDGYSAITVGGTSTFTANNAAAQINLYLGSTDPFSNNAGESNLFTGGITLARNNVNTGFSNVDVRDINPSASVLAGLTSVGTLTNVSLRYDSAPSVALPGMTVTGYLKVNAPSVLNTATIPGNIISQTGPIVVGGNTIMAAGSTGDIVMSNASNDFSTFGIANTGARNLTLVDINALQLYAPGYNEVITGNLSIATNGLISDYTNSLSIGGTATLNAGVANNITLNQHDTWTGAVSMTANNVTLNPWTGLILGNSTIAGTLSLTSQNFGFTLSQVAASAVNMTAGGITTFNNFSNGITLAETGNVFGPLSIGQAGAINIRENDAITQASGWSNYNSVGYAATLTTSNDQAITLTQSGNFFGPLTITQVNTGSITPGAVSVSETGDNLNGMTQGATPWTVHGTTTLNSGAYSIALNNANNVFGPLQVTGGTGSTGSVPVASTVTIYAKNTVGGDAITDVGATGAWNTGSGAVKLVAYDSTGAIAGGGNITLGKTATILGDLYVKATNVTITENDNITDGPSTSWDTAGDTGWVTTGTTNLIVANPATKSITLDNLTNLLGPLGVSTTGTAGTLAAVLITDNSNLTQAAVWNVGAAPVTLDARAHAIDLSGYSNVLGNININTINGTPTSVAITENDAITQGSAWVLTGVPVTLVAQNANTITLTNASNIMGNLGLTGGTVSITENDSITQATGAAAAWTTTGTTTLNPTAGAITLTNSANVLGALAIAGTPSAVSITENDDITQASPWVQAATPFTLNAGAHDIVLSQATNKLGDLTLTAQNAIVTEVDAAGITDGGAWVIPGTTTLTAGTLNPIVLNANPASDFGTVSIVSASNADIADVNGIIFGTSTIAAGGTLTATAGGAITQTGAITAPSLRLIGTGNATLTNASNNVNNLAAGFSGGGLAFTDSGNFAIAIVGGTSGVTIGANGVTLTSVAGTVTGLSNVNASSSSLTLTTGAALSLPQMSIAGPQSYTAGGAGVTLNASVTGTAAGAINFYSPVTLAADLSIQSTNSAINFAGTLAGGTNQLTVNAGSGTVNFHGAVTALGSTGDAAAALALTSSGASFDSTLGANNGLAVTGPVVFSDTVTLANGNAASVFTGLVTLGKIGGMNLSGYNGMTFSAGVLLQNGPATINSNNSPLTFQTAGTVSGPYDLTLNSGTASLSGLNRMGTNLTSLTVTALSPTIPSGGVSIAGPQTYTATGGSSITLAGNVASTAAGAITFNSPVTVSAGSTVSSSNSSVVFGGTVDGNNDLTVSSGSGTKTFSGAVGAVAPLGDGTGAALILLGNGTATFGSTVQARSGVSAAGAVTFNNNVTLANGDTGSTFSGLVTTGGTTGNTISGFDGIAFNGGLALVGGPVSVASNGGTLSFGAAVGGAQNLTLNALAGGAGTVTGLDQIGFTSTLTALNVTAQTLSLPSTGLAVAGPMSFTAAGGITLNGAVGNGSGPATGQIDFNSAVNLATGAIVVTTHNAAVNFNGTVNGAEALTVNAGSGATSFGGAVGGTTALSSIVTDAGGSTTINAASIRTSGTQTYNDPVTLAADSTLTGVNVTFAGALNGAHALTINDTGTTTFAGLVGGSAPLSSLTTDAPGSVAVNTTAVTTSGAQTYNENVILGANVNFSGLGITFGGGVDGAHGLTANAGSGLLRFVGAIGAATPLTSLIASGNTVAVANATTVGSQSYSANGGVTLAGALGTTNSSITITGPTTLAGGATVNSTGGNISFAGATSTINGAHNLTLTAGTGNVVLGGVVGGVAPLTGLTVSGNDLTLPGISTVGDANQSYTALDNITLNQSRTLNAPISFTADSDGNGSGSFILLTGVSLTASNNPLSIQAADLDLQGTSTLSSGSGLMSITATNGRNIALGGSDAAGQLTISGSELARMSSSGGLSLNTTGTGWVHVNGITQAQSQNITGTLGLNAHGTGDVSFIAAASIFNAVTANATGGTINIGVNLTAINHAIEFVTPVSVSGASTISSGGGNISFDNTLAVDNDLTLTTSNGVLSFGGAVGSNKTLTLNLGGGSVTGLGQLQSTLTGLTVNSGSGITLPAFTINGPQVYNTGTIIATGNLGGIGLSFNNVVLVQPASGSALTLNAGTGTLGFGNLVSFNANNMTLTADEINFAAAVTGSGSLLMQPYTAGRNVAVGGSGAPITGLNLTAAELAWLPIGTLSSLTIGSPTGTGSLDVAGVLNAPGTPLTLNGGGGITQSGGSVTSGPLTLYAAGHAINLANGANAFGAVGINGAPSSVGLVNTQNISQLGTAAWNLGSAPLTLNAGTHDITLNNAGNTFGTMVLNGGNVQVTEAADSDIGASSITKSLTVISTIGAINVSGALGVTGNVAFTAFDGINVSGALGATGNVTFIAGGEVTQSAPLTIGGNLSVATTVNEGDVTLNNSGATATTIGDTLVGGDYVLTATGEPVSQAAGTSLQVAGNVTVTGSSIVLAGAGNKIGGTTTLPATSTVVLRQAGVITLGDRTDAGNLTVISERSDRTFSGSPVHGNAITLNNAANNIAGNISVSASPPTIGTTGADQQTGINQTAGTSISIAGVASFTAEASGAGSLGIILTNAGNHFGTLQLSGNIVNVANSSTGLTTIGNAAATTSLTLITGGGVAQSGPLQTPVLAITAAGPVTLNNVANDVNSLAVISGGGAVSYVDANDVVIAGIDAGGGNVSLTAGGTGSLTQTAALLNVGALNANAGGAVTLMNAGNTIASLAASTAGTGLQVLDSAGGLAVSGIVRTVAGDMIVRTSGDLTLNSGGRLAADAGNIVASTEGAGNFINQSGSGTSALVVGTGDRWLVYSNTPDLIAGAHTVKGGLVSGFRHYGATYTTYSPASVSESGDGFIYSHAAASLTVSAIIVGTPSQIYGDAPTATVGYAISSGLLDSEDNVGNVISGGTAAYNTALANTMNAGIYSIKYTGGLTSNYTLTADVLGAAYTVTPATLTYTANAASRTYGAANPSFGGAIGGFKLGQTASVLSGSATWTTAATVGSDVGQYAISGAGYTVGSNYTFAQALGNATAFTIGKASLTVTASGDSKIYSGTLYSGGNGVTYSAFANGQSASALGGTLVYGGTSQGARNVGSYAITASGLTSGNYAITFAGGTLAITKAGLTIDTSNVTKTYDGTLAALGTAVATAGTQLFGGDTLSGGTFGYTNANAGSGNKTVSTGGVAVNDGNGGGNYTVSYVDNTTSTINPASLIVAAGNVIKTYDGTLTAAGAPVVVVGTLFHNVSNGNALDALNGGTFAFTDANAGTANKTVSAGGVSVNDGNGGGNYVLSYANNTTSTINRAALTLAGTIAEKTYDGSTLAVLNGYTLTGMVGGQTLTASAATANFADKNAGTAKAVTISGITLGDGTNGGLAANYVVSPTAGSTGTIDPKLLTLSVTVADKVYDGTTGATLQNNNVGLSGFVGSESVTGLYTGGAIFADKNVGADKAVTVTGIVLVNGANGGLASNYAVSTSANSSADITPATLHIAGVIAMDKVYDGTLTANLNTQASVLAGVYNSDDVHVGSLTGTYLSKDAGANKAIGTGTVVLSGADAYDYILVQPSGLSSSITPRPLSVSAVGNNKVYDGTTAATVSLTDNRIAGDALNVASTDAFLDKSAGTGKYIAVSDITLSGSDAGNYAVNGSTAAFADIAKANLAVAISGVNKIYDGTTAAQVTLIDNHLVEDGVNVSYSTAVFVNKNVGTGKAVAVSGISLSGADADDYTVTPVAATTANITPAALTIMATSQNKVYDASTNATVSLTDDAFAGDQLNLAYTNSSFADKNVGGGKLVSVGGITVGGADAGNYTFNTAASTTANITPATLTVGAVGSSKPYDGTTAATVALTDDRFQGDQLSFEDGGASFANSSVGTGKIITVNGIRIMAGADQNNYVLAATQVTTTADITADARHSVPSDIAGTWSLPPSTPKPLTPSPAVPPQSLLDLTLPVGFGAATSATSGATGTTGTIGTTSTTGITGITGITGDNNRVGTDAPELIVVSLVRPATTELRGMIAVSIPEEIVSSGRGFSFLLPEALINATVAGGNAQIALKNGKRLPGWLRYASGTKSFAAVAMPAGALPVELLVRIGNQRWTMLISERKSR